MKILTYWPGSVHGYGVREKEPDEKMWDDLGRPSPYKQGRRVMTGDHNYHNKVLFELGS